MSRLLAGTDRLCHLLDNEADGSGQGNTTMFAERTRLIEQMLQGDTAEATELDRLVIAEFFVDHPDELDIRFLWRSDCRRFFRVNFWRTDPETGDRYIQRSAFVVIEVFEATARIREVA